MNYWYDVKKIETCCDKIPSFFHSHTSPKKHRKLKTQEEYNQIARIYECARWENSTDVSLTKKNYWLENKEETCLEIDNDYGLSIPTGGSVRSDLFDWLLKSSRIKVKADKKRGYSILNIA